MTAFSLIVLVIGPGVSRVTSYLKIPSVLNSPKVGLKPITLLPAAGTLIEELVSVPIAKEANCKARPLALPPEEP